MQIKTEQIKQVSLVTASGRMDAQTAPQIRQSLQTLIQSGQHHILINMAEVDFVDSSGLSALVSSMKRCRQNGGDLVLTELGPQVRIIFELTRLDKAFEIYADQGAALAAISPAAERDSQGK